MPDQPKKFYLTTPIYYVNARPHIGHAYTTIVADVLARRHRLLGDDTFFLTGTDEHGQKIERSAAAAGIPPQQFADQVSAEFENLWKRMGITNDAYIRTTDPRHAHGVQKLFATLYEKGFIELKAYTGTYCVSDETFVDVPPGTPCPDCGRITETVTEENFFFQLSKFQLPLLDLIESNTLKIENDARRNEVLSFLRGNVAAASPHPHNSAILSEAQSAQQKSVILSEAQRAQSKDPESSEPAPTSQTISTTITPTTNLSSRPESAPFADAVERPAVEPATIAHTAAGTPYLPGALKDLSISRSSFTWGIPVPEPAASAATQKHVIYVWLDALANYMTAIGYGADANPDLNEEERAKAKAQFEKFWPADLHLVGKEIIRFHCVYWPAFLLALNPGYPNVNQPQKSACTNASQPQKTALTDLSQPQNSVILNEMKDPSISSNQPQNSVILSEAQRAQSKDPESPEPATTAQPFETTQLQLTPDQHQLWAAKMLPKAITAHGWLLFDNSKMSKSKGNIVRTETILEAFGTLCPAPTPSQTLSSFDEVGGSASLPAEPLQPTKADRDLFASDVLRYFLLREIPFGQDGSFSFDALITRYNADLANGYGNLVSRTLNMISQYAAGSVPQRLERPVGNLPSLAEHYLFSFISGPGKLAFANDVEKKDYQLRYSAGSLENGIRGAYEFNDFTRIAENLAWAVSATDGYLAENKPWKMADGYDKDDVLYTAAESIRIITALLHPILPYATANVWRQLGLGDIETAAKNGELKNLTWGGLKPGTKLGPLSPIFPRADKSLAETMINMENENAKPQTTPNLSSRPESPRSGDAVERPAGGPATTLKSASTPTPAAPVTTSTFDPAAPPRSFTEAGSEQHVAGSAALTTGPTPLAPLPATPVAAGNTITIDDFIKVELRVAKILLAERIPKADKLLRLEVDLGTETRQILSGIAEWYTPEDLIGRRILVVTNLAPRKMRGLESHGMLLAASEGDNGKPILATMSEDIALGTRLK